MISVWQLVSFALGVAFSAVISAWSIWPEAEFSLGQISGALAVAIGAPIVARWFGE
ncbi:MAG: hypothetical protein NBV67_02450 [Tagaea sp.]|nr:hypothetical protein [Tagaea sp.]